MTVEILLGPTEPCRREMEPMNFLQTALLQPSTEPKGANTAKKAPRRASGHGLPQRGPGFAKDESSSQKNCFAWQGHADIVQKHRNKDERKAVAGKMG